MTATTTETKAPRGPRNGVDTPTLFATINAVAAQPELAKFRFRAVNRWQDGALSRTRIEKFYGAGSEQAHNQTFQLEADHPAVLVGEDRAPLPVEILLHGLAACITAGIATVAAARGVTLTSVESTLEGEMDARGILGLSDEVRNGYQKIRASFRIRGDAPAEKLRAIVEQSRSRSAVYDMVTNGVPVEIDVDAA